MMEYVKDRITEGFVDDYYYYSLEMKEDFVVHTFITTGLFLCLYLCITCYNKKDRLSSLI